MSWDVQSLRGFQGRTWASVLDLDFTRLPALRHRLQGGISRCPHLPAKIQCEFRKRLMYSGRHSRVCFPYLALNSLQLESTTANQQLSLPDRPFKNHISKAICSFTSFHWNSGLCLIIYYSPNDRLPTGYIQLARQISIVAQINELDVSILEDGYLEVKIRKSCVMWLSLIWVFLCMLWLSLTVRENVVSC
jgi:hypothetical protein